MGSTIYSGVLAENLINIQTKENAVIIPRSALVEVVETVVNPESNTIELERRYSVFVSKGDSTAERRTLELGIEQGDRIEVLSGLQPGDNIIITGQQGLEDGGRISVASGTLFQTAEQNSIESIDDGSQNSRQPTMREASNRSGNPFANLSDEERNKIRSMSPEERRAYFQMLRSASNDSTASSPDR